MTDMSFTANYRELMERLEQTEEFTRILGGNDDFPVQFFIDIRPSLKRIRIEGLYLDEQELFDLRRSLETIRDIVRFLTRSDSNDGNGTAPQYPRLQRLAEDIDTFPNLIAQINQILSPYGKIKDKRFAAAGRHPPRTVGHDGFDFAHAQQHIAQRTGRRCGR